MTLFFIPGKTIQMYFYAMKIWPSIQHIFDAIKQPNKNFLQTASIIKKCRRQGSFVPKHRDFIAFSVMVWRWSLLLKGQKYASAATTSLCNIREWGEALILEQFEGVPLHYYPWPCQALRRFTTRMTNFGIFLSVTTFLLQCNLDLVTLLISAKTVT